MPAEIYEIRLTLLSKDIFKMEMKEPGAGGYKVVISMEETGITPLLWENVKAICMKSVDHKLNDIGKEMMAKE